MKRIFLTLILLLYLTVAASAETSLWRVRHNGTTAYIGGTCHVLRSSDYPLPKAFEQAYAKAGLLVFETDIDKFNSPETQALILKNAFYTRDKSLESALSPRVYQMLKKAWGASGMPAAAMNRFRPGMAVLTLVAIEFQKVGVTQTGVDLHFHQKAAADEKKIEWFEEVSEQIKFLVEMGEGNEDAFVEHSLKDIDLVKTMIDPLIDAWKAGDERKLEDLFVADFKKKYPKLYKTMMVDRNNQWLPEIEKYLATPETEMVLVGVGHLVGDDGVIHQLRKRGYSVAKVQ